MKSNATAAEIALAQSLTAKIARATGLDAAYERLAQSITGDEQVMAA